MYGEPSLHSRIKSYLVTVIFLEFIVLIFCWEFLHLYSPGIFVYSFLLLQCPYFGIRGISALLNEFGGAPSSSQFFGWVFKGLTLIILSMFHTICNWSCLVSRFSVLGGWLWGISSLIIAQFTYIFFWFTLGRLCVSRNLPISSSLSYLQTYTICCISIHSSFLWSYVLCISVISVIMSLWILILLVWVLCIFLSLAKGLLILFL